MARFTRLISALFCICLVGQAALAQTQNCAPENCNEEWNSITYDITLGPPYDGCVLTIHYDVIICGGNLVGINMKKLTIGNQQACTDFIAHYQTYPEELPDLTRSLYAKLTEHIFSVMNAGGAYNCPSNLLTFQGFFGSCIWFCAHTAGGGGSSSILGKSERTFDLGGGSIIIEIGRCSDLCCLNSTVQCNVMSK